MEENASFKFPFDASSEDEDAEAGLDASSEFSSETRVKLELETRIFLLMKMIIKTWSFCEITEPAKQLNVPRTNFRLVFGHQLHRG